MPNLFSMPSLSSAMSWARNLISPAVPPQPALFQSRITHTPGAFMPVPGDVAGQYAPTVDPTAMAMAQGNITPQERATLATAWHPQGAGFIMMPPNENVLESTWRHEQMHDLQQKANMAQYANEIANRVDPSIVSVLKEDPVYQREMQKFGVIPTIADEGMALDLTTYANRAGGQSKPLLDYIHAKLRSNPKQLRQFQQLTQPPDQSQKSNR